MSTPMNTRRLKQQMQRRVSNAGVVTKALKRRSGLSVRNGPVDNNGGVSADVSKISKKKRLLVTGNENQDASSNSTDANTASPVDAAPGEDAARELIDKNGDATVPTADGVEEDQNAEAGIDGVDHFNRENDDQSVTDLDTDAELASDDDVNGVDDDGAEEMEVDDVVLDPTAMNRVFQNEN